MRYHPMRAGALVLGLLGGASIAAAQQPSPSADAQQQQQHEKMLQTPSGQSGKEEPSSHVPTDKPAPEAVLVNGALAVPGAPTDSDTVPAKFSQKNAAADKLITVAYTFKTLTDEQRRAIYQALKDRPAGSAFNADIGVELPPAVELNAMPDEVTRRVPQTKGYLYAVAGDRVLLVSPTRVVVGVFRDAAGATTGQGRRTP